MNAPDRRCSLGTFRPAAGNPTVGPPSASGVCWAWSRRRQRRANLPSAHVAKKTATRKPAKRKAVAKKTATRKPAKRKAVAKKTATRKPAKRKAVAKKTAARKPAKRKAVAKKTAARKPAKRKAVAKNSGGNRSRWSRRRRQDQDRRSHRGRGRKGGTSAARRSRDPRCRHDDPGSMGRRERVEPRPCERVAPGRQACPRTARQATIDA